MIICVCGPTGIGKTRLSETIAEKYNAIVVNADATQIYKELDIGSAKITKEEMGDRKHFLFDIVNPNEECVDKDSYLGLNVSIQPTDEFKNLVDLKYKKYKELER